MDTRRLHDYAVAVGAELLSTAVPADPYSTDPEAIRALRARESGLMSTVELTIAMYTADIVFGADPNGYNSYNADDVRMADRLLAVYPDLRISF